MIFCVRNNYSSPLLAFKRQEGPWKPPMTSGQQAASFADKYRNKVDTFESSFHRSLQLPQPQQEDWTALQKFSTSWLVEELSSFTICPRSNELSGLLNLKANERETLSLPKRCISLEFQRRKYPINKDVVKLKIFWDYCSIWRGVKNLSSWKGADLESRCLNIHWNMTEWSSGLCFEPSQACESHHNSSTGDPEIPPRKWGIDPSLMEELLHLSPHCPFIPGGTARVSTTMRQYQRTNRQSKGGESSLG